MLGEMKERAMRSYSTPTSRHGLTLVELMVTLTITAVLLAVAIPQMSEYIARKRVASVAAELAHDIKYARAMVLQQNRPVWFHFGSTTDLSCYVMFVQENGIGECDCTRTSRPVCDPGRNGQTALRSVYIPRSTGITLTATSPYLAYRQAIGEPIVYLGTGQGVIDINSSAGGRLTVVLTGLVRATICSISGHTAEFGDCQ